MSLHNGVASVTLDGDKELALTLIPQGERLLYKVQQIRRTSGCYTFSMSERVDNHRYIRATSSGEINQIYVYVDPFASHQEVIVKKEPINGAYPDFMSGLVEPGRIFTDSKTVKDPQGKDVVVEFDSLKEYTPTRQSYYYFGQRESVQNRTPTVTSEGPQHMPRLAVEPNAETFSAYIGSDRNDERASQHLQERASYYSGRMAVAVQVLLGVGKLSFGQFFPPTAQAGVLVTETLQNVMDRTNVKTVVDERATVVATDPESPDVLTLVEQKYAHDASTHGVAVAYKYYYDCTHGIVEGDNGTQWLVEISVTRGVIAMLLPVFPKSTLEAYRQHAADATNIDLYDALIELKCFPTGRTFPTHDTYDSMRKSGLIMVLASPEELKEFYDRAPYSTDMGWAFSRDGREAHNTCFGYNYDGTGVQRGFHYKITISIGDVKKNRKSGENIATYAQANLVLVEDGPLYAGGFNTLQTRLPIKFHDPLTGGLLSHDANSDYVIAEGDVPRCETTVFVCFIDDTLHAVKYYFNAASGYKNDVDGEEPECTYGTGWTITQQSGATGFPKSMFTSEHDDREAYVAQKVVSNFNSSFVSSTRPVAENFLPNVSWLTAYRYHIFELLSDSDSTYNKVTTSQVVIPQGCREAYFYATGTSADVHTVSHTTTYPFLLDTHVYYGVDGGFTTNGFPFPGPMPFSFSSCEEGSDGNPCGRAYNGFDPVVCGYHNESECADQFSAPWSSLCDNMLPWKSSPPAINLTPVSTSTTENGKGTAKLFFVSRSGEIEIKPFTFENYSPRWTKISPDQDGNVQNMAATYSTVGEQLAIYQTTIDGPWAYFGAIPGGSDSFQASANQCIIGVSG